MQKSDHMQNSNLSARPIFAHPFNEWYAGTDASLQRLLQDHWKQKRFQDQNHSYRAYSQYDDRNPSNNTPACCGATGTGVSDE